MRLTKQDIRFLSSMHIVPGDKQDHYDALFSHAMALEMDKAILQARLRRYQIATWLLVILDFSIAGLLYWSITSSTQRRGAVIHLPALPLFVSQCHAGVCRSEALL